MLQVKTKIMHQNLAAILWQLGCWKINFIVLGLDFAKFLKILWAIFEVTCWIWKKYPTLAILHCCNCQNFVKKKLIYLVTLAAGLSLFTSDCHRFLPSFFGCAPRQKYAAMLNSGLTGQESIYNWYRANSVWCLPKMEKLNYWSLVNS